MNKTLLKLCRITVCFYQVLLLTTCAFLRALTLAKSLISFVLSILFASLFSIDKIARSSSLSCDIIDLRYVFISFSFENDLSANATVTGKVMKSINSLYISGNEELMRLWSMRLLASRTVSVTEISFLNSVANDVSAIGPVNLMQVKCSPFINERYPCE